MLLEQEIDNIRSEFSYVSEFSCMAAFKVFDFNQKGFLTLNDIEESVKDLLGHSQLTR